MESWQEAANGFVVHASSKRSFTMRRIPPTQDNGEKGLLPPRCSLLMPSEGRDLSGLLVFEEFVH